MSDMEIVELPARSRLTWQKRPNCAVRGSDSCFARVPADRRLVDELPADHRLEAQRNEAWRQVVLQIQALR